MSISWQEIFFVFHTEAQRHKEIGENFVISTFSPCLRAFV